MKKINWNKPLLFGINNRDPREDKFQTTWQPIEVTHTPGNPEINTQHCYIVTNSCMNKHVFTEKGEHILEINDGSVWYGNNDYVIKNGGK